MKAEKVDKLSMGDTFDKWYLWVWIILPPPPTPSTHSYIIVLLQQKNTDHSRISIQWNLTLQCLLSRAYFIVVLQISKRGQKSVAS